ITRARVAGTGCAMKYLPRVRVQEAQSARRGSPSGRPRGPGGGPTPPRRQSTDEFVTRNVPLPNENPTGIDPQPAPPTSAMSASPSLLKSPDTGFAPLACAHPGKLPTDALVTRNVPLP